MGLKELRDEASKRGVLRREGIHSETLKKVPTHSGPPGYWMTAARCLRFYLDNFHPAMLTTTP